MPGSTKAQMQFAELIFVMIIFFFILTFGIVFYTQFLAHESTQEAEQIESLNLVEISKIVSTLPELHCSQRGDEQFTCVDIYRARVFAAQLETPFGQNHYKNLFPEYTIRLNCIYPQSICEQTGSLTLVDNIPPDAETTAPFIMPVVIHDPVQQRQAYGEIIITQRT